MTDVRVIDASTVRTLLSPTVAVDAMRSALTAFSARTVYQPTRVTAEDDSLRGPILIMPAAAPGIPAVGLKVLTMFGGDPAHGIPSVQGAVLVIDPVTGGVVALIDATSVTEVRTAAVTNLATDVLARPDARELAIIGAGVQARGHLESLAAVRPWSSVRIYARDAARAAPLVDRAKEQGVPVTLAGSVAEAVQGADVVCVATSACEPVLADSDVARGAHVNGIGAFGASCRELPSALIARSSVFVDSRDGALGEAGDLLIPMREGIVGSEHIVAEIGDVLAGSHPGRGSDDEVTVFKSLGLAIEDVVSCQTVYRLAVEAGLGTVVPFP
jgi:ornithine cyclodeaminase